MQSSAARTVGIFFDSKYESIGWDISTKTHARSNDAKISRTL